MAVPGVPGVQCTWSTEYPIPGYGIRDTGDTGIQVYVQVQYTGGTELYPGTVQQYNVWVEWGKVFDTFCTNKRMNVPGSRSRVPGFLRDLVLFESYLNYVLFVVTVLFYSVMDMKYFRYIGIIDEYVKKRAENSIVGQL